MTGIKTKVTIRISIPRYKLHLPLTMCARISSSILLAVLLAMALSGCGGGGSSTGSAGSTGRGGGGGGGTPSLAISALGPSAVMVGAPILMVTVLGQGFDGSAQVFIDGQLAVNTTYVDSGTVQAQVSIHVDTFNANVGTHQFSVHSGGHVSNTLTYTVYAPQQGPLVMDAIPGFLVGEGANDSPFIVAADTNGDGLADIVMPGPGVSNSLTIAILDGQADGTLSAPHYIPVPIPPYALAVGDVDGNGTADLVSITTDNASLTTVSILWGDGHGNFEQPVTQQTFDGIFPSGPARLVDLNGDGKPGLILSVQQRTGLLYSLLWLQNTGSGFAAPVMLATQAGNNPDFSVGDFNQDGKPDILYVAADRSFHTLLNQGNGQFSDQPTAGLTGIFGLANVLDFNLDGIPDIVVQLSSNSGSQLLSFEGNGNASFTQVASLELPAQIRLVAGDFDHDGFPDLAGAVGHEPAELLFLWGDGTGKFTPQPLIGPYGQYAAVGDFNGDGLPDVVVADRFNFVSLALGRTDRNFPSALVLATPAVAGALSAGDVNGDGLPEIFVGGIYDPNDGAIFPGSMYLNSGNSSFQLVAQTDASSFAIADMTGKGLFDLIGGSANGNLEIWPNNRSLDFSSVSPITVAGQPPSFVKADMDGDGFPDIVSSCQTVDCVAPGKILYGNGSYGFTSVTVPNMSPPFVVGDFDGDGKLDIATANRTLLNMGGRTFRDVENSNLNLGFGTSVLVADFNGDGKDDVALYDQGDVRIVIYYSRGDGTFYQGAIVDPGSEPGAFFAGDFDGDGRIDLAVGSQSSYQVCILFNQGNGQFTRSFFAPGAFGAPIIAADLNRRGKMDLVIENYQLSFAPPNVNVLFHK